jgi:long-chain fatty acid transport protein
MRVNICFLTTIYFATLAPAIAAGYGLREFSTDAMGTAYAGAAATARDASYQAYNPASIASVTGTDFSLTAIGIAPSSSASFTTAQTSAGTPISGATNAKGFIADALIPELALRTRLSDRWSAGVVVYAPWGLATNYPANSDARYYAFKTDLTTINITPSLSYQISPQIAVAAGVQAQYAKGTLSSAIDIGTLGALLSIPKSVPGGSDGAATLTAHNWGAGFILGLNAHLTENITGGISYRSSVQHHLAGTINYTLDASGLGSAIRSATGMFANTQGSADMTTPDTVNSGLRADITSEITALFELDWTNWEKFHQLQVTAANPVQPADITAANWKPAWFGAAGVEYRPEGQWSFRTGVAYDESPIPDSTLGPRIPDGDRITLALGTSYRVNEDADIKLAYEHLFVADRAVNLNPAQPGNALRGTLAGKMQSSVDALGLQFVYRLGETAW